MSLTIQQSSEFSPANVQFSKLRKNKNGGKAVYLNAGDNKKLYLQFPFMRSPYGMSAFTDESTGRTSYSLDLSFDPDNEEAMALHEKLKELDDIIVNTVAANSQEWLGKEFNVEVLKQALYKPMVRPGKEQYPSTIKLKILTNDKGEFIPEAYNNKREEVKLSSLEKGQSMKAIAHISQVWIIDNKCGVTMRLEQAFFAPTDKIKGFAFQDDDEDMGEGEEEEEEEVEEEGEYDE